MELLIALSEFEKAISDFKAQFEAIAQSEIIGEVGLREAIEFFKKTRDDCGRFFIDKASQDIGPALADIIRNEDYGYLAQQNTQFHDKLKHLRNRIQDRIRTLEYISTLLRLSDPIVKGKSFENERAEFTVTEKREFLLKKLYELRKYDRFIDVGTIFSINEVEMDNYDEARDIAMFWKDSGCAEVLAGGRRGVSAKITTEGKAYFQDILSNKEAEEGIEQENSGLLSFFVNPSRIGELKNINSEKFDFKRLIRFCEELNENYTCGNFLSVAMIGRSIINHVPPVFGSVTFAQVANNYPSTTSFKRSMSHLNNSMRSIADSYLHETIRARESLPNSTQVEFKQDLDVLLAEIVRLMK